MDTCTACFYNRSCSRRQTSLCSTHTSPSIHPSIHPVLYTCCLNSAAADTKHTCRHNPPTHSQTNQRNVQIQMCERQHPSQTLNNPSTHQHSNTLSTTPTQPDQVCMMHQSPYASLRKDTSTVTPRVLLLLLQNGHLPAVAATTSLLPSPIHHRAVQPPSMDRHAPVMLAELGPHRWTTMAARSSGLTNCLVGWSASSTFSTTCSTVMPRTRAVSASWFFTRSVWRQRGSTASGMPKSGGGRDVEKVQEDKGTRADSTAGSIS